MATSQKSSKRYVVAGVGAVSVAALVGVGVFATTLTVSGSRGTTLQAGAASPSATVSGCQSGTMSVEEVYETSLNASTGYETPVKTQYAISGIDSTCANKTLTLAVKTTAAGSSAQANEYEVVGTINSMTSSSTQYIPHDGRGGTVTGYSIKIS